MADTTKTTPESDEKITLGIFERIARLFKPEPSASEPEKPLTEPEKPPTEPEKPSENGGKTASPHEKNESTADKFLTKDEFYAFFEKIAKNSTEQATSAADKKTGTTSLPISGGAETEDPVVSAFLKNNPKIKL